MPPSKLEEITSEEQINQFQEEGYLFLPGIFDVNYVDQLRNEADRILELIINSSLANNRRSKRLTLNSDSETQSVREVNPINDLSHLFRHLALQDLPRLLHPITDDDVVSIDPFSQINYKQPLSKSVEEFDFSTISPGYEPHADWPYLYEKVPLKDNLLIGSVVFIDDCTENNGPLELWPGTHHQEFEHESKSHGGISIQSDLLDEDSSQKILGPAGSVLFFDSRLVHRSEPNSTDSSRRLAIYRHASASAIKADICNGSARVATEQDYPYELIESAYENEYRRLKRQDKFEDRFKAPEART